MMCLPALLGVTAPLTYGVTPTLHAQYSATNYTDEIPVLMKGVRYPFAIKPNALLAWTPMTWPLLLGALHWLVELCTVCGRAPCLCTSGAGSDRVSMTLVVRVVRCASHRLVVIVPLRSR